MATCVIEIKDEVNCKLTGLDLHERKELVNKFKYDIPGARYLPAVRLGRWDGKVAFAQLGGSTYINLLPEILPYLDSRGYDISLNDLRTYRTQFEFTEVSESTFADKVWPDKHPIAGQPVVLRDYQIEIINKFLSNPQCLQEIATGAGKTLITAALSYSCEPYGRTIVIVPNKSLVTQTEADYVNLGLDVGVYFGDRKEFGRTHTICTWQSLNILLKGTKAYEVDITIHEFLQDVVCVMVDECFDGSTLITTPDGKKRIKELKPGDRIINLCEETKTYKEDTVVKVHKNLQHTQSEKMLELEFDNGIKTKVTANHKFLTDKGWIRADELTEDLEIISIQDRMKLVSKKEIEKPQVTYNLHVEKDHNYVANDAVVANCHMAKADALKTLLTGVMAHVPIRWGLTGTIPKEQYEFMALKCSIGNVIGRLSASELQDQGVLSNCHVNILQLIDHVEYKDYQSELRYLLETEERLDYISKLIETIRQEGNTLILVDRIAPGKALVEKIKDAVFVSGGTKANVRKESYEEFATSDNFVAVATYGVAAVGINIPRIFNLVLIEPGKSFVRVIQSIGRGIRKAEDKDFVQIWDVTSTCKFAKRHLTTRKKFYTEANYPYAVEKTEWK